MIRNGNLIESNLQNMHPYGSETIKQKIELLENDSVSPRHWAKLTGIENK